MSVLHFVAGKAGAGKTALARTIAADTPAVFISEDQWLSTLADPIRNLDEYLTAARTVRRVLTPHISDILRCGASVVLDFAGNTPRDRQWVRSLFETAGAGHLLHYIRADDATCLARVRERNERKPDGLFFGTVTDEQVAEVNRYFSPPADEEGFRISFYGQ